MMKKINFIILLFSMILIVITFGCVPNNQPTIDSQKDTTENSVIALQQVYNELVGGPTRYDTSQYFKYLVDIGWNASSFQEVINNSWELATNKMLSINSGQPMFLDVAVRGASEPGYAITQMYRKNGQYGIVIWLYLEMSPVVKTPVAFWLRDYAYPVDHEMHHVKRFFKSGIFDGHQANNNLNSESLYQEYLKKILDEHNIPAEFNSTSTASEIDELGVVLETDNPKEIALNIDRILNFITINTLKNDETLGVIEVAPAYLSQIVLAHHLSQAYAKPSVQRQNYSIDKNAFNQLDIRSGLLKKELYDAYPNHIEAMQGLEVIYEEEAIKSIGENAK